MSKAITGFSFDRAPALSKEQHTKFTVDPAGGILSPCRQKSSPNQDDRPDGTVVSILVIHAISLPPGNFGGDAIERFFCNDLDWEEHPYFDEIRGMTVSSHLLIQRDGPVVQFVPFPRRAGHAGRSRFRDASRCNDFSIGIELEGDDVSPYSEPQYTTLIAIGRALLAAYPDITARTIAGHCDVSPGRKTDPGPVFDWLRLYDGLAESVNQSI